MSSLDTIILDIVLIVAGVGATSYAFYIAAMMTLSGGPDQSVPVKFFIFDETAIRKVHRRHAKWINGQLAQHTNNALVVGVWRYPPFGSSRVVEPVETMVVSLSSESLETTPIKLVIRPQNRFAQPSRSTVATDQFYDVRLDFYAGHYLPSGPELEEFEIVLLDNQVFVVFNYPRQIWRFKWMRRNREFHSVYMGVFNKQFDSAHLTQASNSLPILEV